MPITTIPDPTSFTIDGTAGDITTSAVGDAVGAGAIAKAADAGHRHGREAFATPGSSAIGDSAAAGSATTVPRSDHTHGRESSATIAAAISPAWSAWTPALTADTTNPTLGTSSVAQGRYIQIGKLVTAHAEIAFGSSGAAAGSSNYRVSLPVACFNDASQAVRVGWGGILDSSATVRRVVVLRVAAGVTTYAYMDVDLTGAVANTSTFVSDSVPWTWANSDSMRLEFVYEAS